MNVTNASDRDALDRILTHWQLGVGTQESTISRIFALLRPDDYVVITREDAAFAARILHGRAANTLPRTDKERRIRDLAQRLEEAS